MKVAVASSGLGHISRGVEVWALDTARALAERGIDATLFAGGTEGAISNFKFQISNFPLVALPCLRRNSPMAQRLSAMFPRFTWRWGLKSPYGWEQFSFWLRLWPKLRTGGFDILHLQDPMVAFWARKFRGLKLVKTIEILAHGTEESSEFLVGFDNVQHVAPWNMMAEESGKREAGSGKRWNRNVGNTGRTRRRFAIPNFVDTNTFQPVAGLEQKRAHRRAIGIPENAFVIGTVAAVKKDHKRIDYLIREFAAFLKNQEREILEHQASPRGRISAGTHQPSAINHQPSAINHQPSAINHQPSAINHQPSTINHQPFLLIAGAREKDSDELAHLAREMAGDRIKILFDVCREDMPLLYHDMDVFVLTSLFEMMGIAVVEAMASGAPVILNNHPVLAWVAGAEGTAEGGKREAEGGACIDMSKEGELADFLGELTWDWIESRGKNARARALAVFSTDVVVSQYIRMYETIMGMVQ